MLATLIAAVALAGAPAPPAQPIVFILQDQLWSVRANGSAVHRLTHDTHFETDPDISPDGRSIVYVRTGPGGWGRVFVMRADGTGSRMLTGDGKALTTDPAWAPDGRRVAFCEGRHLYVFDGHTMRALTSSLRIDSRPAWSADGRRIAFFRIGPRLTAANLEIVAASGGTPRKLPGVFDSGAWARWRPDGRTIDVAGGRDTVISVNVATGGWHLSRRPGSLGALSLDGRWLAYLGDYPAAGIYIVPRDGSAPPRLVYKSTSVEGVVW